MMKRIISYYGALVHFKNMGPDDEMFDQNKGQYGAYGYLFARTDSELTFKKLIENYADEYRTGIIEISNMEKGRILTEKATIITWAFIPIFRSIVIL